MDVKSVFLNGYINEEVYVEQPPSFEDNKKPDHACVQVEECIVWVKAST